MVKPQRKNFLVFSDLHITPKDYDTTVLKEIAQVIAKGRPDFIICTGDLGEFASQNRLVKDRGSFNISEEITTVVSYFYDYIVKTVKSIQNRQRKDKKRLYKPFIGVCLGNHDAPAAQYLTSLLNGYGVHVSQHRIPMVIHGISFCHTYDNGISGTACVTAADILKNTMFRSVSGHSHVRSVAEQRNVEGYKMFAIKLPCATAAQPQWTPQGSNKWDRGYLWLTIDTETDWYQYTFKELRSIKGGC